MRGPRRVSSVDELRSLIGNMVRIDYTDGRNDITVHARVMEIKNNFMLVRYRRKDRVFRVRQQGKRSWSPRADGVARESFLISDITTGEIRVTPEKEELCGRRTFGRGSRA